MCKVSDQLKLCSCKTKNVEKLKHFWILYKFHESEDVFIGESILPQEFQIGIENDAYNQNVLEQLLNERNCFDVDLTFHPKDILSLNFSCVSESDSKNPISIEYEFVYQNNKWISTESDPFDSKRIQIQQGKIKNAFKK